MCIISWMFNQSYLNCVFCPQILISSISAHTSSAKSETNSTGDSNCWKYWSRTTRPSLRSSETWRQRTERGNGIFWKLKSSRAFKQRSLSYGLATGVKMVAFTWDVKACGNTLMERLDVDCQRTAAIFKTGALRRKATCAWCCWSTDSEPWVTGTKVEHLDGSCLL